MYKLPCPNNVLYLELVGKQPPLGTSTKVERPATALYKHNRNSISASFLISHIPAFHKKNTKKKHHGAKQRFSGLKELAAHLHVPPRGNYLYSS